MNIHWSERLRREIKNNFGSKAFTSAELYPFVKSYRSCPMTYAGLSKQLMVIGCKKVGFTKAQSTDETNHEIVQWRLN